MSDDERPLPDGGDESLPAEVDAGTFAYFSLEGDRFNARGMPADATKEVAAYREALVEIAVDLWKRAHPDRRRAPNGFADAFDLRLTEVLPGSARPQLFLNRPARGVSDEDWTEWEPFYVRARDLATDRVHEVQVSDAVPGDMNPVVRKALGRVGSTLDGEERIRLGAPAGRVRAIVTPRVREVLRRIDEALPEEPQTATAVGVLTEYDGETLSFSLKRDEGVRITCVLEHFNEALAQRAREFLALDGVTAPDVRVEGETLDRGQLRRIFNVHTLEVVWTVAEKVIVHRIQALTKLGAGWLGPGTDAPAPELGELLEPLVSDMAALGHRIAVTANADGALVLEWRVADVEYTAELDADRHLFLCSDNVRTDELASREVAFDADLLRRFMTTGAMQ